MERATSLTTAALLAIAGMVGSAASAGPVPVPEAPAGSPARVDSLPSPRSPVPTDSVANPARADRALPPGIVWTVGAGAPVFPQRARWKSELDQRAKDDSLVVDQPWDGSQLGFSTGLAITARWRFLRPVAGAEWSFWSSRSVLRDPVDESVIERTWRVDQLVGQVGCDALLPPRLFSIKGAHDPYFGLRAAWGVGRLEGLGRAWASGGGWSGRVGADFAAWGPLQLGGALGWTSLSMRSDSPMRRVLYDGAGSDPVEWNGSGIWLDLVLRWDGTSRPAPSDPASRIPSR